MGQRNRVPVIISGVVIIAALCLVFGMRIGDARGGDADELFRLIPENVGSFIYLRDLKQGLSPFLSSDYYDEVSDLAVFDGPFKTDLSAPILTRLGDFEKSTGIRPTPRRLLWIVGKRALFFTAGGMGTGASAGVFETGSFKGLVINLVSVFSGGVAKQDWGDYSVWVVTAGGRQIYYKTTKGYTIFSDSPDLFKDQWEIVTGNNPAAPPRNSRVMNLVSRLPQGYHILYYSTDVMKPDPAAKGLGARMVRLLSGTDAVAAAVTFTQTGFDAALYAPYSTGEAKSDLARLGTLTDKASIDLGPIPGETAALVVFRAFDPSILYTHFSKSWFGDVTERVAYISVLNTWKDKGGFDLEGGIVNNLGRGAMAALVGLGWEAEKPHLKMIASVGVKPGGEVALSGNLSKLYSYSFFDGGPQVITLDNASLSYMGVFREKTIDWNGSDYIVSVKANPGFAFWGGRLFAFWDLSTIQQLIDNEAISSMERAGGLFDRDFLVKSAPFIEAQKKIAADDYDLYAYLDGNNAVSLLENYLVNLSANYTYFLYQDSEKRLLPLLELTRRTFVSCSGGINFTADAVEGTFTLTTKDLDE
ncbi:MAG: hypothetical protein JW765_06745 [Deltaproteobacteria bacterium]|nr:hypothetical protein [Candidatus Zymogenaceae bacterium]